MSFWDNSLPGTTSRDFQRLPSLPGTAKDFQELPGTFAGPGNGDLQPLFRGHEPRANKLSDFCGLFGICWVILWQTYQNNKFKTSGESI